MICYRLSARAEGVKRHLSVRLLSPPLPSPLPLLPSLLCCLHTKFKQQQKLFKVTISPTDLRLSSLSPPPYESLNNSAPVSHVHVSLAPDPSALAVAAFAFCMVIYLKDVCASICLPTWPPIRCCMWSGAWLHGRCMHGKESNVVVICPVSVERDRPWHRSVSNSPPSCPLCNFLHFVPAFL